jgi:hypothetical protein
MTSLLDSDIQSSMDNQFMDWMWFLPSWDQNPLLHQGRVAQVVLPWKFVPVLNLLKPRCTNCHSHPLPWGLSLVTSYGGCQIRVRPLFELDSLLKKILCCQ